MYLTVSETQAKGTGVTMSQQLSLTHAALLHSGQHVASRAADGKVCDASGAVWCRVHGEIVDSGLMQRGWQLVAGVHELCKEDARELLLCYE